MAHVKKVLEGMGVEIQLESQFKYRCIRAKKRKAGSSSVNTSGSVSPLSHGGPGLAAVTMVGSAASSGVSFYL
jgi:protein-serine/threonine kinase